MKRSSRLPFLALPVSVSALALGAGGCDYIDARAVRYDYEIAGNSQIPDTAAAAAAGESGQPAGGAYATCPVHDDAVEAFVIKCDTCGHVYLPNEVLEDMPPGDHEHPIRAENGYFCTEHRDYIPLVHWIMDVFGNPTGGTCPDRQCEGILTVVENFCRTCDHGSESAFSLRCPSCGKPVSVDAVTYCPSCKRTPVAADETVRCEQCSASFEADRPHCQTCASRAREGIETPADAHQPTVTQLARWVCPVCGWQSSVNQVLSPDLDSPASIGLGICQNPQAAPVHQTPLRPVFESFCVACGERSGGAGHLVCTGGADSAHPATPFVTRRGVCTNRACENSLAATPTEAPLAYRFPPGVGFCMSCLERELGQSEGALGSTARLPEQSGSGSGSGSGRQSKALALLNGQIDDVWALAEDLAKPSSNLPPQVVQLMARRYGAQANPQAVFTAIVTNGLRAAGGEPAEVTLDAVKRAPEEVRRTIVDGLREFIFYGLLAVDDTWNRCPRDQQPLRTNEMEAPCWQCGGLRVCPECQGTCRSSADLNECWLCGRSGVCPSCVRVTSTGLRANDGFVEYGGR